MSAQTLQPCSGWLLAHKIFLLYMQTASKLYLVLDFINGGHLFFQLYRHGIFDEDLARLYTAEMVLAIAHLHSLGIAHRDLKPVRPALTLAPTLKHSWLV